MPSPDKTTTTTETPWNIGALENVTKLAGDLHSKGAILPYGGKPLSGLNGLTRQGLNMTKGLARQGVPGLDQATAYNTNLMANGGYTPEMRQSRAAFDPFATSADGLLGSQRGVADYLNPFANGSMQEDPRLQAQLDINAQRASNAAATKYGGGRYGSAAIGHHSGNAVAEANNATMLQSNENARTRQLQASGMLQQLYDTGAAQKMQGGAAQAGIDTGARGAAMQAGSMLPMLNELRYDPATRIAGVGDFIQGRLQTQRDAKVDQINANREANWKHLDRYRAVVQGLAPFGSTKQSTAPGASRAQGLLGGAMAGAGMGSKILPGWGTGIGAGIGGLLGIMG
jgi:hypothetical protein